MIKSPDNKESLSSFPSAYFAVPVEKSYFGRIQNSVFKMDSQRKIRVCVIGGGAAGLCALRHLAKDLNYFEPEAFEQTGKIGGTWVYNDKTGLDDNGLPVHTCMYRDLRTLIPCEILNFPDFRRMKGEKASCVHHEVVLSYLRDYADHFQIQRFIKFYMNVEKVLPEFVQVHQKTIWHVQVKDLKSKEVFHKQFDAVIVSSGQHVKPNIPELLGIETFPGKILHSHSYRKPEEFFEKSVMIIGAGPSGLDIGIGLHSYATKIYLSYDGQRIKSIFPPSLIQVAGIQRVKENTFFLKDGSSVSADVLMYCTGYLITFPFLDESCGIAVDDNYVSPLYKHMINVNYPTMCFLSLNTRLITFLMFHFKAQYFLSLLKNSCSLPSKEEMLEDSRLKVANKWHAHRLFLEQFTLIKTFVKEANLDPLPTFYKKIYELWSSQRNLDRWHHKDWQIIISEEDSTIHLISDNFHQIHNF